MKRVALVAFPALVAVLVGWMAWANVTHVRREELLAIRAAITPGMKREDAARVVRAHVRRTLLQNDDETVPLLCVKEAGYLSAWILCISFDNGRAVAVHIGDYDDIYRAPPGAPSALVWDPAAPPAPSGARLR